MHLTAWRPGEAPILAANPHNSMQGPWTLSVSLDSKLQVYLWYDEVTQVLRSITVCLKSRHKVGAPQSFGEVLTRTWLYRHWVSKLVICSPWE